MPCAKTEERECRTTLSDPTSETAFSMAGTRDMPWIVLPRVLSEAGVENLPLHVLQKPAPYAGLAYDQSSIGTARLACVLVLPHSVQETDCVVNCAEC